MELVRKITERMGKKMMRDIEKTVGNLIEHQKIVMVSSIDEEGFPNTKAMFAPRKREGIRVLYLTTNTSSRRVQQYLHNPKACVYFCDRRFYRGVMLRGTMEILEDHDSKAMIWQEGDTLYYPEGIDDPDYCVLKFTAETGRIYGNLKSENFVIE